MIVVFLLFLGAEKDYYNLLPKTYDKTLLSIYKKPLIFYTEKEVPRAYQHNSGVHNPFYNISATKPAEPFGNANREFPWGHPAGTHNSKIDTFKFVYIPNKVKYWNETLTRRVHPQYTPVLRWKYPDGTIFGEVLLTKGYVFDLRTRVKSDGKWVMNAYRPVLTRDEYDDYLRTFKVEVPKRDFKIERLKNRHPNFTVIDQEAVVDKLPAIPDYLIKFMLKQPFKSALGQEWVSYKGKEGHAPTTDADFHIIPKGYAGGFIAVDSKSCMRCHDGVLKEADDFEQARDWYGRVRGDDAIFTFHPFSKSVIADNGISRGYNFSDLGKKFFSR